LAAEIGIVEFAQPTQRSAAHVVVVVVVIAGIVVVQEARNSHDPAVRMLGRHAGRRRQRRKKMLVRVHGKVSVVVLDGTESGRRQDHLQVGAVPGIRLVVRDFDARVIGRDGRFRRDGSLVGDGHPSAASAAAITTSGIGAIQELLTQMKFTVTEKVDRQ
jgi:hypothetical protein